MDNAQNNLGYCYFNGIGTARDHGTALVWSKRRPNRATLGPSLTLVLITIMGKAFLWIRQKGFTG
jgi:hypothetical protein